MKLFWKTKEKNYVVEIPSGGFGTSNGVRTNARVQVFVPKVLRSQHFLVITSFLSHSTYIETLWNEAWNDPMEMFCSRHTFFLWPYMVSCGVL